MNVKVTIVFFIFFILAGCTKVSSRQNDLKKESARIAKTLRARGEVMENLFVIFDPSFLSYVWPKIKNGVHLNIGHYCWDDVSVFLKDLAEGRSWAYRAADASGRYHSGLFGGQRFWLGSKEQCLMLDENYMSKEINETWGEFYSVEYMNTLFRKEREFGGNIDDWESVLQRDALLRRVVEADNEAPVSLAYTALQIMLNVTKFTMPKSYEITLGLCLPRSCTGEDVVSIINFSIMLNDNLRTNRTVSRSIRITSLRHVERSFDIKSDITSVTLILVTISLFLITIIATIVDLDLIKFKPYTKSLSFDLEQLNDSSEKNVKNVKSTEPKHEEHYNEFKKMTKKAPPVITLDVKPMEGKNCVRCGKYKKQCVSPLQIEVPCPRAKYNSCASLTTEFKKKNSIYKSLLLSFSLKHSWMRIFNTTMANKDLAVVHVMKIVAVFWIMFVHVAVILNYIAENGGDVNDHNKVYYIMSTGTLAFDTLFFVSGLFSAHHFFYLKSRYSVEELVTLGGTCGQALQVICFIINRAVRLLPPYMYAIFLTSILSRVSRDTAALSLPERDYENCASYWWRNILYVTDFYPKEEQCIQVSWYLSTETKLHMIGAFLCLLLATGKRRISGFIAAALLLGATGYDIVNAYSDFGLRVPNSFALYSIMISRGWARVAPYFTGVMAGWMLHMMDGEYSMSKIMSWCFWTATVTSLFVSMSIPWIRVGWIPSWLHVTWPIALLWPALVCATKYSGVTRSILNSPVLAGTSRLCYSALLLHGLVARAVLLQADTALADHFTSLFCYFAGTTLLTLLGALCLSLLVEMPCCCLLRRISDYTYR